MPGLARNALVAAVFALAAGSASADDHTHREAKAHVHGVAEISFVISGQTLSVSLDGPLANVLGYEHAPVTAEERKTAQTATRLLNDPLRIARPSDKAGCKPQTPAIVLPFDAPGRHDHEDQHARDDEHGDADHGDAPHVHMDLEATYTFTCARIARLDHIDVTAFKTFPGIKTVEGVVLGPGIQFSRRLTPSAPVLKLK
ncbi:MAG: DUF2796 domain-containing protein [Hyphomonadaceae bacterium]